VRKERRQHLHQIIDRHGCDLTHITDRRGSPQTLVCTKTTASYEAAYKPMVLVSYKLFNILYIY
jgi:hypothetical protein